MSDHKKSNFYLGLVTAIAALVLSGCAQQTADPVASSVSSTGDASASSSSCGEENQVVDFGNGFLADAEVIPGANLKVQLLRDQNTGELVFGDLFIDSGEKSNRVSVGTIIYKGQNLSGQKYSIGSEQVDDAMHIHVKDRESGQKVADLAKLAGITARDEFAVHQAVSSLDGCIAVYKAQKNGALISGGFAYLTLKELKSFSSEVSPISSE